MICVKCDSSVSDDSRYCPQCGQATALAEASRGPSDAGITDSGTLAMSSTALQAVRATSHLATPVLAAAPALNLLDAEKLYNQLTQANLCRVRQDWSCAIDHCVTVLQEQPGNATAHSLLSDIYRDQGKLDDAIQWARLAIDLKPSPAGRGETAKTGSGTDASDAAGRFAGLRQRPEPFHDAGGGTAGCRPARLT